MSPEAPGLVDAIRSLCKTEDPLRHPATGDGPIRSLLGLLDKEGQKKDAATKILTELGPDAKEVLQAIATPGRFNRPVAGPVDQSPSAPARS